MTPPPFDFALLLHGEYHDWLVHGFWLSVQLTAWTLLFALPLATGIAVLRMSARQALRTFGAAYVEAVRSVPLLAHLLFWYFGAPELLPESARQWLQTNSNMELLSAVIALSLYTAAYMAEDIRSGIRTVPPTQFQAALALGLSKAATLRHVVLPQALRVTLAPLLSQTLTLWKDTSVATVIGVAELMYQAARIESASFRSAESFVFATAAYLTVSLAITALATWVGHRHPVRTR